MIDEIRICDVALIRDAHFSPHESLTAITGETGAGKTALLNALKLLLGERFDSSFIREGSDELKVEGRFFFGEDNEGHVVSRRVTRRGRSKISINGSLASVGELAECIGAHIDLCGQHEHQHVRSLSYQRHILDAWASNEVAPVQQRYRECFEEVEHVQAEVDRLRELVTTDNVELDRARFALDQIEAVQPQEGEYEDILAVLPKLEHAETLITEATKCQEVLTGQGGVLERLDEVVSMLDHIERIDAGASELLSTVREAYFMLEDVGREIARYRDSIEFSPDELESLQQRLASLQGLMRGFGPRMEDVFALREESQNKLAEYEGRDELILQAVASRDQAEQRLEHAANELREVRNAVLPRFLEAVNNQMARLEMGSAHLVARLVDLDRDQWDIWGPHSFELMYAPGEACKPQRLSKIASGGEMSRIMLALKVVLGSNDTVETLVFDEIDAGVGGSTARAVADVLVDLAQTHQVVVVTHLPQIAVCAHLQYVVTKSGGEHPETTLSLVSEHERVKEIARMLSGEVSEVSLAHAQQLLDERQ